MGQRKEKDNMTSQITVGGSTTVRTNQGMFVRTNLSGEPAIRGGSCSLIPFFFFLLYFPLCPSTDFSCSRHFTKKTGRGNGPDHRLSTNRLSRTWHFTTVSVGHFTITKKTRFVFNLYFNLVISTRLP